MPFKTKMMKQILIISNYNLHNLGTVYNIAPIFHILDHFSPSSYLTIETNCPSPLECDPCIDAVS